MCYPFVHICDWEGVIGRPPRGTRVGGGRGCFSGGWLVGGCLWLQRGRQHRSHSGAAYVLGASSFPHSAHEAHFPRLDLDQRSNGDPGAPLRQASKAPMYAPACWSMCWSCWTCCYPNREDQHDARRACIGRGEPMRLDCRQSEYKGTGTRGRRPAFFSQSGRRRVRVDAGWREGWRRGARRWMRAGGGHRQRAGGRGGEAGG